MGVGIFMALALLAYLAGKNEADLDSAPGRWPRQVQEQERVYYGVVSKEMIEKPEGRDNKKTCPAKVLLSGGGKYKATVHLARKVCFDELGCFEATRPFFSYRYRPISLLPDSPEKIGTTYRLYTRAQPKGDVTFSNQDQSSLYKLPGSGFDANKPTKIIVPGYLSQSTPFWLQALVDALLGWEDSNVFFVDWSGGSGFLYPQATANTRVVGAELALFIQKMQNKTTVDLKQFHISGFSLGAQVAGYAGKRLNKIGRITAMDPAGPYFSQVDPVVRLDRGDALLVDVIHTNAAGSVYRGLGSRESIGHFDFWPNGGSLQPGCEYLGEAIAKFIVGSFFEKQTLGALACNHYRAIALLTSSYNKRAGCTLMGVACPDWKTYTEGRCANCTEGPCVPLGARASEFADKIYQTKSIDLYLNTTAKEPFCGNGSWPQSQGQDWSISTENVTRGFR